MLGLLPGGEFRVRRITPDGTQYAPIDTTLDWPTVVGMAREWAIYFPGDCMIIVDTDGTDIAMVDRHGMMAMVDLTRPPSKN